MKGRIVQGMALAGALSALAACSAIENLGGAKKVSPDEFRIVSHAPLAMPPNADLRPPTPGAPRPQEQSPQAEARSIVTGTGGTGGTTPGRGKTGPAEAGTSPGESALLAKAGQTGGSVDPDIRSKVNRESKVIADSNRSLIDSLIFWQPSAEPGVLLDPGKEQQRLREAQATGTQPQGGTPTIERRKRGILEGIF
ncbi:MAG: DUF3035 domain-containing protein [Alphaproteobacteria bacterium]|nr:DUF3035 domain-containing protein [Alphaproteobacteria bacterium]